MSDGNVENTDAIAKVFDAADVLAETAGKVYADKKVDLDDLPHAIGGLAQAQKFLDAIKSFGEAVGEAQNLKSDELLMLATRMIAVGKKYESARKGE